MPEILEAPSPVFAAPVEHQPGRIVVSMHGELDLLSAPDLQRRLLALMRLPVTRVALDLSHLTFMDSAGLSALVRVQKAAAARRIELEVLEPSEHITWMLSLTGLAPLGAPA